MRGANAVAAGVIAAICVIEPAAAQRGSVVTYICNIEGAQAQLTANVQAVTSAGVFVDGAGMFAGSVSTGDVTYYYEGQLVSATARYVPGREPVRRLRRSRHKRPLPCANGGAGPAAADDH